MRCGKCGNENADANRFCGMCGAPLSGKPAAWPSTPPRAPTENVGGGSRSTPESPSPYAKETSRIPQATFDRNVPPQPRAEPSVRHDDRPVITGPSFLGLNQPSSRAGLGELRGSHDAQHSSSDRLAYLLEDEEEAPSRNWVKIVLVVVALVLIAGLAYMHWMQGGFESLLGKPKPSEVQPPADMSQTSTDSGSAKTNAAPSSASAPTAQTAPPGNDATGTGTTGSAATQSAPAGTGVAPVGNAAGDVKENLPPSAGAQDTAAGTPANNSVATPKQSQPPPSETSAMAKSTPPTQPLDSEEEPPAKPTAGSRTDSRRTAASVAAKPAPFNPVTEAERYLYGRGVRQDCDRGLRLLKPAAATANSAAMISMGALYSTGTCTPRDLPTAYRWFAMALHKEPNNQALQDDLQKLWSRMTPPERQLAIKLSK